MPPGRRQRPRRPVAVALSHDRGTAALPRVVASGYGKVAEQILELAFANGVKVREDADLAQILSAVDLDTEIPLEAIVAVAEILAHVYRANGLTGPDGEGAGPAAAGLYQGEDGAGGVTAAPGAME